jgi:MFS transporter, ACS family, glucarate transporter
MIHPRRTGVVFLMVLLSVMTYIDRIIITIAGPGIMKEFSVSETQMGTIYSAYLLSYAIMMIPGGWFTDVAGPRVSLAVMAFGTGLFTALTALGGTPGLGTYIGVVASFLVIRLATGICASPMYPAAGRMSANWNAPHARARVWGWIASGAGFGARITAGAVLFSWREPAARRSPVPGIGTCATTRSWRTAHALLRVECPLPGKTCSPIET